MAQVDSACETMEYLTEILYFSCMDILNLKTTIIVIIFSIVILFYDIYYYYVFLL